MKGSVCKVLNWLVNMLLLCAGFRLVKVNRGDMYIPYSDYMDLKNGNVPAALSHLGDVVRKDGKNYLVYWSWDD